MKRENTDAPNRSSALRGGESGVGLPARIIAAASRERPADAVLREELKAVRNMMPQDMRAIAQTVFNYYRWRGWLDLKKPLVTQIRLARELTEKFATAPGSFTDADLVARGVPDWVRAQMEVSPVWVRAIQSQPKLWLRARRGQGAVLGERLGIVLERRSPNRRVGEMAYQRAESEFGVPFPDAIRYTGEEDLFRRAEFHAGEFEIQDIASQAVGLLCAPKPGETWWDACAGEGGKLLHLSDLMENKGLIWASDRAAWRLKNLKRRTARAKVFNYRAALWNGGAKLPTKTKFDGVLVDAPCSGVGTWQRNPHARWTTTAEDVIELAEVQGRLLAHVAPSVKPGGKLIYSVCTLTRSETDGVVQCFNETRSDFEPLPLTFAHSEDKNGRALTSAATITIWPQDLGGNGMFVAAWRRKD